MTDWRGIIAALEAAGGYAPIRDVLRAAGCGHNDGGLNAATFHDPRLYECVGTDGRVWLGLDPESKRPACAQSQPTLSLTVAGTTGAEV